MNDNKRDFKDTYNSVLQSYSGIDGAYHAANYINRVEVSIDNAKELLNSLAEKNINKTVDTLKGDLSEAWHAGTLLIDAARNKQADVFADIPRDRGPVDVVYGDNNNTYNAQLKYYKTSADTAKEISNPKYDNYEKVVPSDQLDGVKDYAHKQSLRNVNTRPDQSDSYKHTSEVAQDRIKVGDSESKPISEKEMKEMANDYKKGEPDLDKYGLNTESILQWSDIFKDSGEAAAHAALITATLKSVPYIWGIIENYLKEGDLDLDEIKNNGINVISDSGIAGLRGGISAVITGSCKAGLLGSSLKNVSLEFIGAATVITMNAIKYSFAYYKGDITKGEFVGNITRDVIITSCAVGGAAIGQALIPIPVLGALIGNMVGGLLVGIAYNAGEKLFFALLIEKGWTCFDLVEQNYTVSQDVLRRVGYNELIAIGDFSTKSFTTNDFSVHSFTVNSLSIQPLKRGLIRCDVIRYAS